MKDQSVSFERPHRYADEAVLPIWPSFLEKLLLAIIDANPEDDRPAFERASDVGRQKRLDTALEALTGRKRKRGNKQLYLLHAAMAVVDGVMPASSAEAFERVVLGLPKQDRTKASSRRKAFSQHNSILVGLSDESRTKRLKAFEQKHRRYLQELSLLRHHPEEEDIFNDMQVVAAILQRWNIGCSIEPEALGMASLWVRK